MSPQTRPPLKNVLEWVAVTSLYENIVDSGKAWRGKRFHIYVNQMQSGKFKVTIWRAGKGIGKWYGPNKNTQWAPPRKREIPNGRLKEAIIMQYLIWRSTCGRH